MYSISGSASSMKIMLTVLIINYTNEAKSDDNKRFLHHVSFLTTDVGFYDVFVVIASLADLKLRSYTDIK